MNSKYFILLCVLKGLFAGLIFCGFSNAQNIDSANHPSILTIRENSFHLNNPFQANNFFFNGTAKLNYIAVPEYNKTVSGLFSGLRDPYIRQFLEEEAIKNNLIRYIRDSAPKKEAEEITAIRKYLGISRDIFAVILAIIHVMTY